jgi:capsular polysaccharide biosynthesis protein
VPLDPADTGPGRGIPFGPPPDVPLGTPPDVPLGTPPDVPLGTPPGVPLGPPEPASGVDGGADPSGGAPKRPHVAGPLEAFLRHPFTTLLPLLLLVAGAVFLGVQRDPEYTAQARIAVGTTDVSPVLLEEVVAGNQSLAASYARAIATSPVITAAAREIGIAPTDAADRLDATPVPGSTLIQVEATGLSEAAAVALANAGASELIDYVKRLNRTNETAELFRNYRRAQAAARRAERRTQELLHSERRDSPVTTRARIKQDIAALKASDLANRYRAASQSASNASRLTLIAPAATADSDARDVFEQLLLVGAVGGLVLGIALALLRANWRRLRTLRGT